MMTNVYEQEMLFFFKSKLPLGYLGGSQVTNSSLVLSATTTGKGTPSGALSLVVADAGCPTVQPPPVHAWSKYRYKLQSTKLY